MKLTVVGCSDAFGSGGRLQTCFHVAAEDGAFLIDCGATALIGLQRLGLDPNLVSTIFVTHLHGDHFGGLVWWLIHAQHVSRRTAPLAIIGPRGTEARFITAAEALFPGATGKDPAFALSFREWSEGEPLVVGAVRATPFEVSHPSGAPPYALRFEVEGKTLGFSGDSEWTESLIPAARGADLFIIECFGYETDVRYHMTWRTIEKNLDRLGAKRVLLTHMGPEMLAKGHRVANPRVSLAEDGMIIDL